ncbi:flavin reductase family protein [Peribacillus asahii]|uniref:Nitrilotriacetate monooxygenase n=1 Tax=Peribacillus asahii TaxID=228899 RepID=A0A3Q9RR22_9BACI|nr:flavin reductase [Peribacillus asahii]AZV44342.1 nitrilotriacetate monooxygenase [Peribacillus asahii]USK84044.1 flavin reductase [Peribacillus asahii]
MISIDPNTESEKGNYKLLIGSIIPRSVAFVTTLAEDGTLNAAYKREFVIHISDESYIHAINETAANLPPDQSEVELTKLTPIESEAISVPGIQEASIRMECLVDTILPFGGIDAQVLKPVSRLAGNDYALLGAQFSIERPE